MTLEKNTDTKHVIDSDKETLAEEHPQEELLRWHHRLVQLPLGDIILLSLFGITPKRLANVNPPKCKGFVYGSKTKRTWCTK